MKKNPTLELNSQTPAAVLRASLLMDYASALVKKNRPMAECIIALADEDREMTAMLMRLHGESPDNIKSATGHELAVETQH